jgi:hypothetical protein
MTVTLRPPAILAVVVDGYSHLTGEKEAATPDSVPERREVARPVDVDAALANVSYPPTETSADPIANGRLTSTPAV